MVDIKIVIAYTCLYKLQEESGKEGNHVSQDIYNDA